MRNKMTTEQFVERAQILHINKITNEPKYDYSLVEYIGSKTKVKIICLSHGEFLQTPNNHLNGIKCYDCSCEDRGKLRRSNSEIFINKAEKIHIDENGDPKYDYSLVEYITCMTKVIIICPKEGHGEFLQTPHDNLAGKGCPICGKTQISTTEKFIKKSQQIHIDVNGNQLYDYGLVDYIKCSEKIIIICNEHGEFLQTPSSHLKGAGCPHCIESKGEKKIRNFLIENNITFIRQKIFNDCRNIYPLKFDFYLPDYNLCIEYDGIQHFKSREHFGGEEGLRGTQLHDKIKTDYCLNNNIRLIRIPYWDFKNIDSILEKELNIIHVEK